MPESKTKLARELSADELEMFCQRLKGEKRLTLARIQEIAGEYGVEIGHTAAAAFRDREFEPWLTRLNRRRQLALYLNEHSRPEDIATLADASAGELSQSIFEFLAESEDASAIDLATPDGRKAAGQLSLIISRIRMGDHRLRLLESKLADMQAQREQLAATLDSPDVRKGMSESTRATIMEAFNFRPAPPAESSTAGEGAKQAA